MYVSIHRIKVNGVQCCLDPIIIQNMKSLVTKRDKRHFFFNELLQESVLYLVGIEKSMFNFT